ncbi:hypothetical protein RGU77_09315 [Actimicrobium sp. CCI2.3]|uniref:hypothetical protein n=1 Tax=Actimicrobium sp. CCI2.3 TaxID=3048616 RepID=UPI002AB553F5|nr:hypothetical protein [Actimicrobium sp. CCI2.3]MDY7574481.1 hypothetical protein [Actimicrobium sp. CCI2.3]
MTDAEERAWISFYDHIDDASVAAELLSYIEADPELKRTRSGLYLCARQSVRRANARYARALRVGQSVRAVIDVTVFAPVILTRRLLRVLVFYAVEMLPQLRWHQAAESQLPKAVEKKTDFPAVLPRSVFERKMAEILPLGCPK